MDIRLLAIPITFVVMAAVLCWCLVVMRRDWRWRLALILVLPAFGLLVWSAIPTYMGWPAAVDPPEKIVLLWAEVREPDRRTGDAGALYLWAVAYDEETSRRLFFVAYPAVEGEPRAYRFPYSRQGHETLARAKDRLSKGYPVILEMLQQGSGEEADGMGRETDIDPTARPSSEDGRDEEMRFKMYELPGAAYPPKDE